MKKLLTCLVILFTWIVTTTGQVNEEIKTDSNVKVEAVEIEKVVRGSFEDTPIETVYYSDGTEEIFMSYLYIEDVDLRKKYITYRNVKADYIKSFTTFTHKMDFMAFNHFLEMNGYDLLTGKEYNEQIQLPLLFHELNNACNTLFVSNWWFTVLVIAAFVYIYRYYKNTPSKNITVADDVSAVDRSQEQNTS